LILSFSIVITDPVSWRFFTCLMNNSRVPLTGFVFFVLNFHLILLPPPLDDIGSARFSIVKRSSQFGRPLHVLFPSLMAEFGTFFA